MYVFVVRITVHGLVRKFLRIEEAVDLLFFKISDIVITDSLLVRNVENVTDRMS